MNSEPIPTANTKLSGVSFQIIESLEGLQPWAEQWDSLAVRMPQKLAVLSWTWMNAYLRYRVSASERWFCVIAETDGELLGVMPAMVRQRRTGPVSHLILTMPFDWHTTSSDCVVAPGTENSVLPALIARAFEHVPEADWLEMTRLPESSPTIEHCQELSGYSVTTEHDARGSFFTATGDFESYFQGLSGDFRRKLRRGQRGLERDSDHEIRFRVVTDGWPLELERLMVLEEAGWKGDTGSAIRGLESLVAFYRELASGLCGHGWLELYLLESGDQLLAGLFGIRFSGSITLLKTCYDERYRRHSPGNVALLNVIQRAFALDDIERVDGMTWAPYHERWHVTYCDYFHVRVYRPGVKSYLLGRLPRAARNWARRQNWLRSLLGKHREEVR